MRGDARAIISPSRMLYHAPASNTAAVIEAAEMAGTSHVLKAAYWSYTGTGTLDASARLTVELSVNTVYTTYLMHYIALKGPGELYFLDGVFRNGSMEGCGVKVTLVAGGTDVTGRLSCVFL